MMKAENLITKGFALEGWSGEVVAELGDVKARLFHLTPDKEMVIDEDGHDVNEWIVVLSGEILVKTSQGALVLKEGDSFIVPPGTPHRLNVTKPAVGLIVRDMKLAPTHAIPGAVVDVEKKLSSS